MQQATPTGPSEIDTPLKVEGPVQRKFVIDLLLLLEDTRLLYLFEPTGSTLIDRSKNERAGATLLNNPENHGLLTWAKRVSDFDTPPSTLGNGIQITINGTDDEVGDILDSGDLSFGDGNVDQAFSVFALFDSIEIIFPILFQVLISKNSEWNFGLSISHNPFLLLTDKSTGSIIGRSFNTALAISTPVLLVATYSGSSSSAGIKVYSGAIRVDDTDNNTGTPYIAMEDTKSVVNLGHESHRGGFFFNGSMGLVGVTGGELTISKIETLRDLCNTYFYLSL